ncbi:MAG: sugar phosphate isomerase/epimerase [Planctomycetota bacterium]|jgi:sugar phosphate isomerase/epimerase|nr:sugar phosphate isomerase/epimerase [Planctomycetota bacterium]
MTDRSNHSDIRLGTLVQGNGDPAGYIKQINQHGFESYSITFWQTLGGKDLAKMADEVRAACAESGAVISSLCPFGNPLGTEAQDDELRQAWRSCIDHAEAFGCDIVGGFAGGVTGSSVPDSIARFKEVFEPLADYAGEKGIRLVFENCCMGGNWNSVTCNIALGPKAWELMFDAVPAANVGLEWEPCHQLVMLADPMPQLRHWGDRIFHVHGKDASIYHDVIAEQGTGLGPDPFCHHRHPGFGDSNWTDIISRLRLNGFRGSIDIEGWHDPVYRGDLEMTGQVKSFEYLKQCRGAAFVGNPS